jgi:drug/metabolite transporter (DMT)-like permease
VLDIAGNARLDPVGVLWGLGAATGLAVYFVMSAGTDDPLPPLVVAWGGLVVGTVVLLAAGAAGLLPFDAARADVVLLDAQVSWLVPVLGLALVAAVVAYVTGIVAARLLGAKIASFLGLTEVLWAVVFAWVLLGQSLGAVQLLGGALVVGGIALVRVDELGAGEPPVPVAAHEAVVARAD